MRVTMELTAYSVWDMLWSGAQDTLEDLTVEDVTIILDILEGCQPKDGYTLTDINDIFWFERDTIAKWLGYNNYDELMEARHV